MSTKSSWFIIYTVPELISISTDVLGVSATEIMKPLGRWLPPAKTIKLTSTPSCSAPLAPSGGPGWFDAVYCMTVSSWRASPFILQSLSENRIGVEEAMAISSMLHETRWLTRLNLSGNIQSSVQNYVSHEIQWFKFHPWEFPPVDHWHVLYNSSKTLLW